MFEAFVGNVSNTWQKWLQTKPPYQKLQLCNKLDSPMYSRHQEHAFSVLASTNSNLYLPIRCSSFKTNKIFIASLTWSFLLRRLRFVEYVKFKTTGGITFTE